MEKLVRYCRRQTAVASDSVDGDSSRSAESRASNSSSTVSRGRRWITAQFSKKIRTILKIWISLASTQHRHSSPVRPFRASMEGRRPALDPTELAFPQSQIQSVNRLAFGRGLGAGAERARGQRRLPSFEAARPSPARGILNRTTHAIETMVTDKLQEGAPSLPRDERGVGQWRGSNAQLDLEHSTVHFQDFRYPDAYGLPGNDDYRKNVDSKMQALETHVKELEANGQDLRILRQNLNDLRENCLRTLETRADLEPARIRPADQAAVEYVNKTTDRAAKIMGHFLQQAVEEVQQIDPDFSLEQLRRIEQECNGRDCAQNLVTAYNQNGRTFIETAIPKQKEMQVSSVRDTDAVPNFYYRTMHVQNQESGDLEALTGIYMHSSLPAIGIGKTSTWTKKSSKTLERDATSRVILDKVLTTIAQDYVDSMADSSKLGAGSEIELPLSVQSLFTPVLQDERVLGTASERLQLKLTSLLYDTVNHRSIPLKLRLSDGEFRTVYVKPEIEHLNFGTNGQAVDAAPLYASPRALTAKLGLTGIDEGLNDQVNHKSWIQMMDDVQTRLDEQPFQLLGAETQELQQLVAQRESQKTESYQRKRRKVQRMTDPNSPIQVELTQKRKELDGLLRLYHLQKKEWNAHHPGEPFSSSLEGEYLTCKRRTIHLENKIRGAYSELIGEEKQLFKKSRALDQRIIASKKELLLHNASKVSAELRNQLIQDLEIHQTMLEMQDLYFSTERGGLGGLFQVPKYTKVQRNHELQCAAQHLAKLRDRIQVVNCKSTEDRSGKLNTELKQRYATEVIAGSMPRFSDNIEAANPQLRQTLNQGVAIGMERGVDRQVCERMDPGCGYLQIYGKANSNVPHLADIHRAAATMAKRPYREAGL